MRKSRGWPCLAIMTAMALSACDPSSSSLSAPPGAGPDGFGSNATVPPYDSALTGTAALDAEEVAFFNLINDYRAQNGLPRLEVSVSLTQAADWLSNDMADRGYFDHTDSQGRDPFTRIADFGYTARYYSGENIAAGNADAQSTFTQWKNSAAHNANMLGSSYRAIGIARAYRAGSSYGWYWTNDFGG